jgi:hypothetical protein
VLKDSAHAQDVFPLEHGEGTGRLRLSLLFRPVSARLPRALLRADDGALRVRGVACDAPALAGCGVRLSIGTGEDEQRLSHRGAQAEAVPDGAHGTVWRAEPGQALRWDVPHRLRNPLVVAFHASSSESIGAALTHPRRAAAALWLRDAPDGRDARLAVPLWAPVRGEDDDALEVLARDYAALDGALASWDEEDSRRIHRIGTVWVELEFAPALGRPAVAEDDAHEHMDEARRPRGGDEELPDHGPVAQDFVEETAAHAYGRPLSPVPSGDERSLSSCEAGYDMGAFDGRTRGPRTSGTTSNRISYVPSTLGALSTRAVEDDGVHGGGKDSRQSSLPSSTHAVEDEAMRRGSRQSSALSTAGELSTRAVEDEPARAKPNATSGARPLSTLTFATGTSTRAVEDEAGRQGSRQSSDPSSGAASRPLSTLTFATGTSTRAVEDASLRRAGTTSTAGHTSTHAVEDGGLSRATTASGMSDGRSARADENAGGASAGAAKGAWRASAAPSAWTAVTNDTTGAVEDVGGVERRTTTGSGRTATTFTSTRAIEDGGASVDRNHTSSSGRTSTTCDAVENGGAGAGVRRAPTAASTFYAFAPHGVMSPEPLPSGAQTPDSLLGGSVPEEGPEYGEVAPRRPTMSPGESGNTVLSTDAVENEDADSSSEAPRLLPTDIIHNGAPSPASSSESHVSFAGVPGVDHNGPGTDDTSEEPELDGYGSDAESNASGETAGTEGSAGSALRRRGGLRAKGRGARLRAGSATSKPARTADWLRAHVGDAAGAIRDKLHLREREPEVETEA